MVEVLVGTDGVVKNASIYQSTGYAAADAAAIDAARATTYRPKIVNCQPAEGRYLFKADFTYGLTATPAPLPSPPPVYSLDGVTLGSAVTAYIAERGKPNVQSGSSYVWRKGQGGSLTVKTDSVGTIAIIDVRAGKKEIRSIDVLGRLAHFNDGGHINEPPPLWVPLWAAGDGCGAGLRGSPCSSYLLPKDGELVMNFGGDNGMADWDLTEVIVGYRAALLESGFVVKQPTQL